MVNRDYLNSFKGSAYTVVVDLNEAHLGMINIYTLLCSDGLNPNGLKMILKRDPLKFFRAIFLFYYSADLALTCNWQKHIASAQ